MVTKSKDKKAVEKICAGLPDDKKVIEKEKAIKSIKKSLPKIAKKEIPKEVIIERPMLPEFKEIKIIKVGFKFNIIGILRKMNSIGKYFKIIGYTEYEKNFYKWIKGLFKKKEKQVIPVIKKELSDISKSNKDYSGYFEVNDENN